MKVAQRFQKARTAMAEIAEVVRIGTALEHRRITPQQASEAISRVGRPQRTNSADGYELVSS